MRDPYDTDDYTKFVEAMAKLCRCEPSSCRPCDGVLAGGLCDRMDWRERDRDDEDWENE